MLAEWRAVGSGELEVLNLNLAGSWPFFMIIKWLKNTHMLPTNPIFDGKCIGDINGQNEPCRHHFIILPVSLQDRAEQQSLRNITYRCYKPRTVEK